MPEIDIESHQHSTIREFHRPKKIIIFFESLIRLTICIQGDFVPLGTIT